LNALETTALVTLVAAFLFAGYTFAGYPLVLRVLDALRRSGRSGDREDRTTDPLPSITITVPAYNEEAQIAGLIENLLQLDYPRDRMQILIVSDASTDGTDAIVQGYAHRGVELIRSNVRKGKTGIENLARTHARAEIVVNTDASIRLHPDSVRRLVHALSDPAVGVASGRDVSVARHGDDANVGESGYVGFEMWVRSVETRVHGIVGASGCLYAIRRELHQRALPEMLSRDFAAALTAREAGFRAVSVDGAICFVPRTTSVKAEYRRKVRTIARGMATLTFMRKLLNPSRYGLFAWMLWSHKICRWALPWVLALAAIATLILARDFMIARVAAALGGIVLLLAMVGWYWPDPSRTPRIAAMPAFFLASNVAAMAAFLRFVRGRRDPVWEPTRRETASTHASTTRT
jgi:cellulose synthase/poly-beta-1,6-N-acetylglucosamine synthase-like glycosyltransferase